jgi:HSP20 family protein
MDVTINNQTITIRTSTKEEEKGKYFRREITRGEFQRTVSLPDNIDVKASFFKDGILKAGDWFLPSINHGRLIPLDNHCH